MIHENSLKAFYDLINSGQKETELTRIYNHIKKHPCCTSYDLENDLNIPRISIRARLCELQDLGVIKSTLPVNWNGRHVSSFIVETDPLKIAQNAKERRILKMQSCVDRLLNEFYDLLPEKITDDLHTFSVYGKD